MVLYKVCFLIRSEINPWNKMSLKRISCYLALMTQCEVSSSLCCIHHWLKSLGFFSIRNPQREQDAQYPKRCFSWFFYVEILMSFIWPPCIVVELSCSIWRHGLQWHNLSSSGRIFLNTIILGTVTLTVSKLEALRCKNGCFCYLYKEGLYFIWGFFPLIL
jgi:hypothetical protein